jgi:hypothetical protein
MIIMAIADEILNTLMARDYCSEDIPDLLDSGLSADDVLRILVTEGAATPEEILEILQSSEFDDLETAKGYFTETIVED